MVINICIQARSAQVIANGVSKINYKENVSKTDVHYGKKSFLAGVSGLSLPGRRMQQEVFV